VAPGVRPAFSSSNLIAQFYAARAGHGVCVLPCFIADQDDRLVRVLAGGISLVRSFWMIVHADMRELARIRIVSEFIAREVRAAAGQFGGERQG
jgi:DNA-binding transcriptional LysR family regulator